MKINKKSDFLSHQITKDFKNYCCSLLERLQKKRVLLYCWQEFEFMLFLSRDSAGGTYKKFKCAYLNNSTSSDISYGICCPREYVCLCVHIPTKKFAAAFFTSSNQINTCYMKLIHTIALSQLISKHFQPFDLEQVAYLSLSFLICKMGMIIVLLSLGACERQEETMYIACLYGK